MERECNLYSMNDDHTSAAHVQLTLQQVAVTLLKEAAVTLFPILHYRFSNTLLSCLH